MIEPLRLLWYNPAPFCNRSSPHPATSMIPRRDFLLGAIASSVLATQLRAGFVPDGDIRAVLRDRIESARQSVGIVACSFDSGDQKIVAYGHSGAGNGRPLDGDTVFEIGSITKVFTAL